MTRPKKRPSLFEKEMSVTDHNLLNPRMAWVEKAHSAHLVPTPAMCRITNQQPRLPRATSSLALNACRDGASTASLGNLFSASPPSG